MKPLRELFRHSAIYAVGQILTRMASVMLLPLYTHCLTPEDYGITAILDLTASILSLMIGGGMVTAVTRFHFDHDSEEHRDRVWWTGLTWISLAAIAILLPLWLARHWLSGLTLGSAQVSGPWFYTLTLLTTWAYVVGNICDTYLRVQKWSGLFVIVSLLRLLLNVGLNVWLLAGLQMGVQGLLLGNLLATVLHSAALLAIFAITRGTFRFDVDIARQLFRFSLPLVVMALLCMLMHEADRYVLRVLVSMDQVGVYSLAHKIGFAVNTLCLMPFISIWHVAVYDIDRLPDSGQIFARIYRWFTSGLGILLLGAALVVHPILPLLTPDAYGDAIDLVSVILLGFFFFGLQIQFEVPALLARRPGLLTIGSVVGVIVNLAANLLLIPRFGVWGAGWAGVVTYAACSFTIYARCRGARQISYPWLHTALLVPALCMTWLVVRGMAFPGLGVPGQVLISVAVCAAWALALFARDALTWWKDGRRHSDRSEPTDSPAGSPTAAAAERVPVAQADMS